MNPCEASIFEDRRRIAFETAAPSPRFRNVWFAYWVCSMPDFDSFLEGRLPRNTPFELKEMSDWMAVMTFQYDREDQSCDCDGGEDVSASEEREINGLRPLAPIQHYPFINHSPMMAAVGMLGTPQICLSETWGKTEPLEFRRAIVGWKSPTIHQPKGPEHAFDQRLRKLLSLEPGKSKVMMVICGYGAPRGEYYAQPAHRRQAWEKFGFAISSRVPTPSELRPIVTTGAVTTLPTLADITPSSPRLKPNIIDPHRYLMLCLAEPLEAGSLSVFFKYWAAVGIRLGEIPGHLGAMAPSHTWAMTRALETLKRYIGGGLLTIGQPRSFYDEGAGATSSTDAAGTPCCVSVISSDITETLRSIAKAIEEHAASGDHGTLKEMSRRLSKYGVCLTDKGWAFRLSLEPQVDALTQEVLSWGEGLPFELLEPDN